jgi:threonyl-tRNA synthetase
MLIVEKKKRKTGPFLYVDGQEGKGNVTVTIEEFGAIVDEEIKKTIYSLT